jgi:hypothetical protein
VRVHEVDLEVLLALELPAVTGAVVSRAGGDSGDSGGGRRQRPSRRGCVSAGGRTLSLPSSSSSLASNCACWSESMKPNRSSLPNALAPAVAVAVAVAAAAEALFSSAAAAVGP